jgi:hypothetical protein
MEGREEETAACRYISHRKISDSPWAQVDVIPIGSTTTRVDFAVGTKQADVVMTSVVE